MTDTVLREDMALCAKTLNDNGLLPALAGKTVFITGATGLIGSQMVRTLLEANRLYDADITVAAFIRNEQKANAMFEDILPNDKLDFVIGDLSRPVSYDKPVDYVVHGASATGSKFFVESPVETIQTAIYGTDRLLQFARDKQVSGMVYLSSLEVYGVPDGTNETISESDYGLIEPLSVRSSYSEGKRMVECLCASYASEYGVPVKGGPPLPDLRRRRRIPRRPCVRGVRPLSHGEEGHRPPHGRLHGPQLLLHRRRGLRPLHHPSEG